MIRRSCFAWGVLALGVVASEPVSAALLESEPFNYPGALGASVNGQTGGSGWATAWADPDADVTLATTNTSLAYPAGNGLAATGGRVELSAADTLAQATRDLGTTMNLGTSGQTWYSSGLFRRSAVTGERSTVSFFSGANLRWFYGVDDNGNFTVAVDPANAGQRATTAFAAAADTTYLVVARIRTNTGPTSTDEVFLKVFGPADTVFEPANDDAWDIRANGNSGVILSQVRLDLVNAAGQTNQFDEFRIGTTFADAAGVPEPAFGLAGAAAVGMLSLRRRKAV